MAEEEGFPSIRRSRRLSRVAPRGSATQGKLLIPPLPALMTSGSFGGSERILAERTGLTLPSANLRGPFGVLCEGIFQGEGKRVSRMK